jgi:cholesterol oxidase
MDDGLSVINGQSSIVGHARYAVTYRSSTKLLKQTHTVHANNIIFAAGVMGTMKLLLNLRDVKKSLPKLSGRLGHMVRTNSEALLGSVARQSDINYSEGVAITSIYNLMRSLASSLSVP